MRYFVYKTISVVVFCFVLFLLFSPVSFYKNFVKEAKATDSTWAWQNPLPQGNPVRGVSARTASDIWAVGSQGTALHYNGSSWSISSTGVTAVLNGVSALDASNVWAVGNSGTIIHYNGSSWSSQTSGTSSHLYGVFALDSTHVWAAGASGTMLFYNGSSWSSQTSGVTYQINDIWALDSSNVWAAVDGSFGEADAQIIYFNGTTWSQQTQTGSQLKGISGVNGSNIWAVGVKDPLTGNSNMILKYDGATWTETTGTIGNMRDVYAVDTSNVWAVCGNGAIYYYNGSDWATQTSGTTDVIYGVSAVTSSNVYAVGDKGMLLHYNGSAWSSQNTGVAGGSTFYDVWAADSSNAWAVDRSNAEILYYNGSVWAEQSTGLQALAAVSGVDATHVWVAAQSSDILSPGYYIYYYNGSTWSEQTSGAGWALNGIYALDSTHVWAVGDSGNILFYNGSTWSSQTSGTANSLKDVYAADSSNVWAVGSSGTVIRFNGTSWADASAGLSNTVEEVTGSDANNVWVLDVLAGMETHNLIIRYYNGSSWSTQQTLELSSLMGGGSGLSATSSSNVWMVYMNNTYYKYNGSTWSSSAPTISSFYAYNIFALDTYTAWAVGDYGLVLYYSGGSSPPSATFVNDFSTWQGGTISARYNIIDTNSSTCNISQTATSGVEYSTNNSTWTDATQGSGGDGMTSLTSSPAGVQHTFAWNSSTDLSATEDSTVWMRVRPNNGTDDAEAWVSSNSFGVDNVGPTSVGTPTFGTAATSSIIVNKPSATDSGSGLNSWRVRRTLSNDATTSTVSDWISDSTSTYTDTSLTANTSYTYDIQFKDAVGNTSSYSASAVKYTAASAPNVTSDKEANRAYSDSAFVFTNAAGFGSGGVGSYKYKWNQIASDSAAISDSNWNSGTLSLTASATGAWYLHVLSINTAGDVASTQTYGPFIYQKGSALSLTKDVGINTGDTTSSLSPKPFASVWTLLSGNWLVAMIIALIAITILVPLSVLIPNKKGKGELTETLRHLPSFLSKEPSLVFNKVVPKGGNGTWPLSYSHYKKAYSISRRAAVVAIVLIIIKIVIAILLWASPFPAVTAYSDDGQEIQPGDELTYKIIYKNETGSTLNDLIVSDDIPSGTDFISGSLIINGSRQTDAADTDNAYVATNKVVFNISTVVDNASGYVMFRTKVNLPNTEDKVQNSAISKSDEISWVSSNATSNLLEKAGVSGYVFRDKNGNKAKDGEETGISSVAMKIYEDSNGDSQLSREKDTLIATKITDLKGKYEFAGLRSGNYFIDVSESTLAAYELTTSNPLKVTLERGKNFEDINFGYKLKQGKQDKKEEEDKKEAEDEGRDEGKQVKESTKISILLVPTGRDASIAEGILQFMVSTNDDKFKVYRNANFVISVQPKKPVINVIAEVSSGLVDVYELFDEDGDGVYAAEIRAPVESGLHTIKITENYTDGTSSESVREFYVEPVGYVYQLFDNMEVRLSDAKVTLFNKDGNEWKVWNAVEYNQKNPQITSESGEYTLMVSGGIYKLTAEKEGYESFESDEIRLADPGPINIKIELFKSRFMAEIAEGVVEDYYFWIGASVVIVITGVTVMLLRRRYKKGMKY